VAEKAHAYYQEAQNSLDESTIRFIFGSLDAFSVLTAGISSTGYSAFKLSKTAASKLEAVFKKTKLGGTLKISNIVDMQWGKGIVSQGIPFEKFVQSKLPKGTLDLNSFKTNFRIYDHFNPLDGTATSTKTMDMIGSKTYLNPKAITRQLNKYIDKMKSFTGDKVKNFALTDSKIKSRVMQLGIPYNTTKEQMAAIQKSIDYAASLPDKPIKIVITKIK
jgi:filamentous hemagglutinin